MCSYHIYMHVMTWVCVIVLRIISNYVNKIRVFTCNANKIQLTIATKTVENTFSQ